MHVLNLKKDDTLCTFDGGAGHKKNTFYASETVDTYRWLLKMLKLYVDIYVLFQSKEESQWHQVWYEDAQSLSYKYQLAKDTNIAGRTAIYYHFVL